MTDKEIIKALEICGDDDAGCMECPFEKQYFCRTTLSSNALDLINRQQAEIERLKNSYKQCAYERDVFLRENPVEMALLIDEQAEKLKTIKTEAIKEFADRLKEKIGDSHFQNYGLAILEIHDLVKEMVGEENGRV